ncbi:hypothetical protein ScPMuIL_011328 [Solemya velum]
MTPLTSTGKTQQALCPRTGDKYDFICLQNRSCTFAVTQGEFLAVMNLSGRLLICLVSLLPGNILACIQVDAFDNLCTTVGIDFD